MPVYIVTLGIFASIAITAIVVLYVLYISSRLGTVEQQLADMTKRIDDLSHRLK